MSQCGAAPDTFQCCPAESMVLEIPSSQKLPSPQGLRTSARSSALRWKTRLLETSLNHEVFSWGGQAGGLWLQPPHAASSPDSGHSPWQHGATLFLVPTCGRPTGSQMPPTGVMGQKGDVRSISVLHGSPDRIPIQWFWHGSTWTGEYRPFFTHQVLTSCEH